MLRWLMTWCVPKHALRLERGNELAVETRGRGDHDVEGGLNLRVALASHGVGVSDADPAVHGLA